MRAGSDTGGTFTDLVGDDGTIAKVPSTPDDPARAVAAGLEALGRGRPEVLAHGTTVGTNALLERRGATVALVTNQGFADVIEIGRQDRPSLYDQTVDRPEPLVARRHRYEVPGRLDATGAELEPVDPDALAAIDPAVQAVAVVGLHADLDGGQEQAVAARLRSLGHDVCASHEVSPEFREVERTVTTVINAYLRPVCRGYLRGLAPLAPEVAVMTSAGGLVPAEAAAERPVDLLVSGPAGGVLAGADAAVANGWPDAITFDMGGTSTDVCLITDGHPAPAAARSVAGVEVRVPSLDVHTIGAGGGSIAGLDAGGALTVGPASAGAEPGPACYGHGGTAPTVTDANLVAGRLAAGAVLPGIGVLDEAAAARAIEGAGVSAEGILAVVDAAMVEALRAVSVQRGVDPRGLALVAFGGAGPLHACGLAEALDMPAVIVPARAGVLSAAGILAADEQRHLVRSWGRPEVHDGLDAARHELAELARYQLDPSDSANIEVETWLDCRYRGQSHELTVSSRSAFHDEHRRRNGYASPERPVEVVAVRARARRPSPVRLADLPAPPRSGAVGPRVIAGADCTIWVPEGWRADPGVAGALVLTRMPKAPVGRPADQRARKSELDPASLQILISRLTGVAEEMSAVLRRAAYSPNIKERADCSAAVFTAAGDLLAQAENIPVHLGSMPASVRAAIDAFGARLAPGEQVILNDPFAGGTHLNDITVVAPCFVDPRPGTGERPELVGWVATRAHHADVGGEAPGSLPADATDIAQEGLRLAPQRLTDEVRARLLRASRTPDERAGDLDAQAGANRVGVARLAALAGQAFDEVLEHGERRMRAVLVGLPDGAWRFEDVIDSFGPGPDQQEPSVVAVELAVEGDRIRFDFTASAPQRLGNVNAVEAVTASSVAFAVRAALDPTLPANAGTLRPVTVVTRPGSIVHAVAPAAVGAGNVEVSQRVADVCFGALAQVPGLAVPAASQGTMNNVLIGNDRWVYYETLAGGQGGHPRVDGMSGVHTHMTNTRNTPIEVLERAFPMRVRRLRLRRGSGGDGVHPGGEGIERDLEVLEPATLSLITERRRTAPWGLDGGDPGAVGENWLLPGGDEDRARRLPDKITLELVAGDVVRILTPGGGGWGPPPG